ncbi:MAG: TIGR02757 family protein [Sphingobacteriia bacterium]|nr:MAG: TIGR02757 family protein [Sphingobacteriia bacterium]
MKDQDLRAFLNQKVKWFNQPHFIESDPIVVPHGFKAQADIEISGFFAAIFAWGNRTTIINKTKELMGRMDHAPHAFCLQASARELKGLEGFKHRTFNTTDLLHCVAFFQQHYQAHDSLENAFLPKSGKPKDIEQALTLFHERFFADPDAPERTRKHVSTPVRGSSCKRLNMYLRWMVRQDKKGVDFGLWKNIKPAQLICPLDVHVARVARHLGLLQRPGADWAAAQELTAALRQLDSKDPVKYDFALFGLGVFEKMG